MKKNIMLIALAVCILIGLMPQFALAEDGCEWQKSGVAAFTKTGYTALTEGAAIESGETYTISTREELGYLAGIVNGGDDCSGATFILSNDIDLNVGVTFSFVSDTGLVEVAKIGEDTFWIGTGIIGDEGGNTTFDSEAGTTGAIYSDATSTGTGTAPDWLDEWTAIGYYISSYNNAIFKGAFDGDGHTVSGIYLNTAESEGSYQGLFGYADGTIKNLGVVNSGIFGYKYTGGVAGYMDTSSVIEACYNTGCVAGSDRYTGGVVGYNRSETMSDCYNTGSILGYTYVGGVAGSQSGELTGCYNTGNVAADGAVGGVAGEASGAITDCHNSGSVRAYRMTSVGGVFGALSESDTMVEYCYNTGSVTGCYYTAGIVGYHMGGTVQYCYNTGDISATSSGTGGVAGYIRWSNSIVRYCFNVGNVSSSSYTYYTGGVAGHSGQGTMEYCYNTGSVTGGGVIGFIDSAGIVTNCYNAGRATNSGVVDTLSSGTVTYCYYDKQICTVGGINRNDRAGMAEGLSTSEMTAGTLFTGWDDCAGGWNFTSGLYPCLKEIGEIDASKLSVSPLFLENDETVKSVSSNFGVSVENGVSWASGNSDVISISGGTASVIMPDSDTDVTLTASLGEVSRTVVLTAAGPIAAYSAVASASTDTPAAGGINTITLTVKDSAGNTDTAYGKTVKVTVTGYEAAPDGTYGSFNGTALSGTSRYVYLRFTEGVATADLILYNADEQIIGFSIYGLKIAAANDLTIAVTAGAAASMTVTTQPEPGPAGGDAFDPQPVVTLYDPYDNVCSTGASASASVTASAKAGTGSWTIGGTASVTASSGVAAFTDLTCTLTSNGTGAVTFSCGSLSVDSDSFTILGVSNEDAVAAAKTALTDGSVNVAYGATQADKTAAVQSYVNGLLSNTTDAAGATAVVSYSSGTGKYDVALEKGSVTDSKSLSMTVNEAPDPDIATVAGAKTAAADATYNDLTQAEAPDEAAAKAAVKAVAEAAVGDETVTVTITDGSYTAATAGTSADPNGTDGSHSFTVTVSKGIQSATTEAKTVAITATAYTGVTDVQAVVAAKDALTDGSVDVAYGATQADKTAAVQSYVNGLLSNTADAAGVTATVTYNGGTGQYDVALSKGSETDSKSLSMTVNECADPDIATVAGARTAAAGATYNNLTQAEAPDEAAAEAAVKAVAEAAVNNGTVTVTINTVSYTAPAAGTSADPDGTDGSYSFTVTVSKGIQSATTEAKTIAITATAYTGVTDVQAVAAAKNALTGGSVDVAYGATQADKTAAVQSYVDELLDDVSDATGVTATVTYNSGTGNYDVALSKGSETDSKSLSMTVSVAKKGQRQKR